MANNKKTMKISTRYSLSIGILFLVGIIGVVTLVNIYMRRQALAEAESKALEMLDYRLAVHTYFSHQLKPKLFEFTEEFRQTDHFEPTWMSSTYAVREMGKYANHAGSKGYYYKECAINARSPENEADSYEREFLKKLAEKSDLISESSIRYLAGEPFFAVLRRGEAMEESCLRCHSDPQTAPKGLVDIYGPERSFHRKVGEVTQAISIRIPLSVAYSSANRFSFELSGLLFVIFGLLILFHFYNSRRWIFSPLNAIREKALLIAEKKEHLGEKIDVPKGQELKELAGAFNTLSEKLREHTDHLENMIQIRTQQIMDSEKRFRLFFENAPLGYQSLDKNGNFIDVNLAWLDLFGYQKEEVIGKSFGDFVHPDWCGHFKENFPIFKSIGEILGIEFEMVKKNGALFTVSIDGKIVKGEDGQFLRTHCILTDITERKMAEEKLIALSSRQKAILSAVPDIIMEVDHNKIYTWANSVGFDFFGDDVIGKKADDYFEEAQETYTVVQPLFNGDESVIYVESWQRRKDGQKRLLAWWCRVLKDPLGKVSGALSTAHDITEKKQAEEALIKLAHEWQTTFDSSNDVIWILDKDQRIVRSNRKAEEYFHGLLDQMIGKHCWEIVHATGQPISECPLLRARNSLKREEMELKIGEGWLEITVDPILNDAGQFNGAVHVITDTTERNRLKDEREKMQAQLSQAQKMESVGRLAGGVAHDYNNALTSIMGFTELAMMDADPKGPLHADLSQVLKSAKRAKDITRQLLAFARKQTIAPVVLDLNETVESMFKMLRRLIGEDIDLVWMPGKDLGNVKMDPSQIDQILANLCVNARDAIEGVGKITIETKKIFFDEDYCADHTGFIPGEFVLLALTDNGCGMDKEILNNIFEPFFTTKPVDKGTGLGLSTVFGIVKQNNGFINVYSEPGKGTVIKVYLPQHEDEAVEIQKENTAEIPQGQGETILLVEDDLSILKLAQKILERLNYTVLIAGTPKVGIKLAEGHTGEIHLLVTDVIMPEMNGLELLKQLKFLYPDLKCVFMSGYTANAIAHHGVLDEGVHFVQKPFAKKDMALIVRKVLDE